MYKTKKLPLKSINKMTLTEAALFYASLGLSIFPLQPRGKTPLISKAKGGKGCLDATTDPEQIERWWDIYPDANIGLATGSKSGIVVVDLESDKALSDLISLIPEDECLPLTPESTTARGRHLIFQDPGDIKNSASKLGAGIDIRGTGGYIAAPPSIHPSGHVYQWFNDAAFPPLPSWLAEKLKSKSPAAKAEVTDDRSVVEGSRNMTLTRMAGSLRRQGCGYPEILTALMSTNDHRCDPPLDEREVARIAQSISKYDSSHVRAYTELGNAERFADLHDQCILYCGEIGVWFAWTGTHWDQLRHEQVIGRAMEVIEVIRLEADQIERNGGDKQVVQAAKKHATRSQSRSQLENMVDLAKSLMPVELDQFDEGPWLLNVANGTLNLITSELRPHCKEDFITRIIDLEYDPDALPTQWLRFIDEITNGDTELADYLQRMCGYTLTGLTTEQCFFLLLGDGANGKSTFLELLLDLMGPYARKASMQMLLLSNRDNIRSDLARLRGARLVVAMEVAEGERFNESLIKEITGGDLITARQLYKEHIEFRPQFKLMIGANEHPRIAGTDEGIWRRIKVIPFDVWFSPSQRDPEMLYKLKEEAPGILLWCVQGAKLWAQEKSLGSSERVDRASLEHRQKVDAIPYFFDEKMRALRNRSIPVREAYAEYVMWSDARSLGTVSDQVFGRKMSKLGYPSAPRKNVRVYPGLTLVSSISSGGF